MAAEILLTEFEASNLGETPATLRHERGPDRR